MSDGLLPGKIAQTGGKKAWVVLVCLLLLSLACNAPRMGGPALPDPSGVATARALETRLFAPPATLAPSPTAAPTLTPTLTWTPAPSPTAAGLFAGLATSAPGGAGEAPETFTYFTQPGDTLPALEKRFGVAAGEMRAPIPLDAHKLLPPGYPLEVPNRLGDTSPAGALLPDSELVYSPGAADFDIAAYIRAAGGYLATHREAVDGVEMSGTQIVRTLALETSTNPRLLLAVLEYRAGWVRGRPGNPDVTFPLGFQNGTMKGLFKELTLAARYLTIGYYGWRSGELTGLKFADGSSLRLAPGLNAGSVGLMNLLATLEGRAAWQRELYGERGFLQLYSEMFGDPWARAARVEPLLAHDLQPPALQLPFLPGKAWSFSGGPHPAWGMGSASGGVDFAPVTASGCGVSAEWATAVADGLVVRSERGVVALDLDGDGREQTGWVVIYIHLAEAGRVAAGTQVQVDERMGHPSCEGGFASGANVHIARKHNGEWIAAGEPLPLALGDCAVEAGDKPYAGRLVCGDGQTAVAMSDGSKGTLITRKAGE